MAHVSFLKCSLSIVVAKAQQQWLTQLAPLQLPPLDGTQSKSYYHREVDRQGCLLIPHSSGLGSVPQLSGRILFFLMTGG